YYGFRCRRFRRHFVAGQYGRPIRMVDHLGLHWPQKHLPGLSRGGHHPILAHRFLWWKFDGAVYYRGDLYSVVLRWRFLHGSGLSEGYVRCVPGWCHSRTTIDRLVRRRYCWPLIVNSVVESQAKAGHEGPDLYTLSMLIMVGLLAVGLIANILMRPVAEKHTIENGRTQGAKQY